MQIYGTKKVQNSVVLTQEKMYYQGKRIECPEINPYIDGQLIFHNGAKSIQRGESSILRQPDFHKQMNEIGHLDHIAHKH